MKAFLALLLTVSLLLVFIDETQGSPSQALTLAPWGKCSDCQQERLTLCSERRTCPTDACKAAALNPVGPAQAPVGPPQATFGPPRAPVGPPHAPVGTPQATFGPPRAPAPVGPPPTPAADTETNACQSEPCLNYGSCFVGNGGLEYMCQCKLGYTGQNCHSHPGYCASNPCLNGGTCTPTGNGYQCDCTSAYKGSHCEDQILATIQDLENVGIEKIEPVNYNILKEGSFLSKGSGWCAYYENPSVNFTLASPLTSILGINIKTDSATQALPLFRASYQVDKDKTGTWTEVDGEEFGYGILPSTAAQDGSGVIHTLIFDRIDTAAPIKKLLFSFVKENGVRLCVKFQFIIAS